MKPPSGIRTSLSRVSVYFFVLERYTNKPLRISFCTYKILGVRHDPKLNAQSTAPPIKLSHVLHHFDAEILR